MDSTRPVQERPRSLEKFMRQEQEVLIFEDFRRSEARLHPGFREHTAFDSQRLEFRTTHIDQVLLRKLRDGLLATLRTHNVDADLRDKVQDAGWEEILDLYEEYINDIDESKAKGNRVRDLARRGKKAIGTTSGLVSVIPDEKGLNVLKEGLAYVLLVWKRYIDARDKIISILAEVPTIIAKFHSRWAVFHCDTRAQCAMDDFLSVMFDSLTSLIEILVPHLKGMAAWTKRVFRRFTDQETDAIHETASRIDESCKMISSLFDQLGHERIATIEKTGAASLRETKAIRESNHNMTMILQDINSRLVRVEEQQQRPSVTSDTQAQNVLLMVPAQLMATMQTGLYNIVSENEYIKHYGLWCTNQSINKDPSRKLVPITKEGLLTVLNEPTSALGAFEDLKIIMRRNSSMRPEGLDRAHSLMSHDAFKSFVAQDDAALLLVNGHCRSDGTGKTSPLSVWCASFVAVLKQSPTLVVLHYFCGLHTNAGRVLSGPLGLVKSLIGQLLEYEVTGNPQTAYSDSTTLQGATENDIGCLCYILKELLSQLGHSRIVFCIIDNVCEFERKSWGNWLQDLTQVFETLYGFVNHEKLGGQIRLKVLLTSADRSTHLVDKVRTRELISLHGESTGQDFTINNTLLSSPIPMPPSWSSLRQSPADNTIIEHAGAGITEQELR